MCICVCVCMFVCESQHQASNFTLCHSSPAPPHRGGVMDEKCNSDLHDVSARGTTQRHHASVAVCSTATESTVTVTVRQISILTAEPVSISGITVIPFQYVFSYSLLLCPLRLLYLHKKHMTPKQSIKGSIHSII